MGKSVCAGLILYPRVRSALKASARRGGSGVRSRRNSLTTDNVISHTPPHQRVEQHAGEPEQARWGAVYTHVKFT